METNLRKLSKIKVLFLLFILSHFNSNSQNNSSQNIDVKNSFLSDFNLGADFKSRYIWRGIALGGNTPSIQPYLEYNFAKGWSLGAWGAYSFGEQTNQELDLFISYTTPNEKLNFILTDYFFPDYSKRKGHYFGYNSNSGHVFELLASANPFTFPLGFTIATNFYGADKIIDSNGITIDKQSLSTYIETNYSTSIATVDLSFFAGFVFSNKGGYYGLSKHEFINIGVTASKEIKITDNFSLPIDASLIFNPEDDNAFLVFGISI